MGEFLDQLRLAKETYDKNSGNLGTGDLKVIVSDVREAPKQF